MTLSRVMPWVMPGVVFLTAVVSPLANVLDVRDLDRLNFLAAADAEGLASWITRLATLAILGGCCLTIAMRVRRDALTWSVATIVLAGYLLFFLTNSVLNSLFGTEPGFNRSQVYPLIFLVALYFARDRDGDHLLESVKLALFAVMVASLLFTLVAPHATLRTYAPEVRLPFVTFRYWGLGNSPNTTGPLALMLMLLVVHRPFRSMLLTVAAVLVGATTVLLAQSQTTWMTAAVVMPLYLLYRYKVGPQAVFDPPGKMFMPALVLVVMGLVAAVIAPSIGLSLDGLADDKAFTGRGQIWRLAVDLYEENPLFGYGPLAWETEFRVRVGLPFAYTAHNQPLQSLSTAGLVGLVGWLIYAGVLVVAAIALARPTRGLAPALVLAFPLIRAFSEATFEFKTILGDEFIMHMIVFMVLTADRAMEDQPDCRPAPSRWTRQELPADDVADFRR